jgi:hypothetical protein
MQKKMRLPLLFFVLAFMTALLVSGRPAAAQTPGTEIVIGQRVVLPSKIFNRDLTLSISLPADYETSAAKYPVLYDLNAFLCFTHDAGTVDSLSRPGLSFIPEMIVVGLPQLPVDFVPTPYEERDSTPKAADLLLKFFKEELMPFVEGKYRASGFNILTGHSVAGLFTMYALFTQPDLFSAGIASSPWFRALDQYWLKHIDKMFQAESLAHKHLFMTVGKMEQDLTISTFTELEKWMKSKDLKGLNWASGWLDRVDHMSMVGRSLYEGLLSIFDGWQVPYDLAMSGNISAIEDYAVKIRAKFGGLIDYRIPEDLLSECRQRLLEEKAYDRALALFNLSLKLDPDNWKITYDLAEMQRARGDKESARKNYALSVQKNQGRTEAEKVLLRIATARLNPSLASAKTMKLYPGVYGVRTVTLEKGVLYYQRAGRPKFRLVPLTETIYAPDGYDNFWIEFVLSGGKATEIVGLYGLGQWDSSPRTK